MKTKPARMARRHSKTLGDLSVKDRLLLGIVLKKARFMQWLYSPDPTSLQWIPPTADALLAQLVQTDGQTALRSFVKYVFPPGNDDRAALEIQSANEDTREWVEWFLDQGVDHAFGGAYSLTQWLSGIAEEVMVKPRVPVAVFWGEDGLFDTRLLLPGGVERLSDGSYRVYPAQAHHWHQDDHPTTAYELPAEDIVVFERPTALGFTLPIVRALPHYAEELMANQRGLAAAYAWAHPEDRTLRAQLAHVLPNRGPSIEQLPKTRMVRGLHGSLLEQDLMGFGSLSAPVTDHYLVWQHREVLKAGTLLRDMLLEYASTRLLSPAVKKAGLESNEVRLTPRQAPSEEDIQRAYDEFIEGSIDKAEFHHETWWR